MLKFFYLAFLIICSSCHFNQDEKAQTDYSSSNDSLKAQQLLKSFAEPSAEEQIALDLLDELQVSSATPNRLYSTYPNIDQPCYPPDTVLQISQADFGEALRLFIRQHYPELGQWEVEDRTIKIASVQTKYRLALCQSEWDGKQLSEDNPPTGTWVLQGYLGRRDLILHW